MRTRILLADDHAIFMQGLRALLLPEPDMEVIGEARDGREAVKAATTLRPQVVIMDTSMPGMNGIEATRRITAEEPQIKILCLSMHGVPRLVERVMEAGASGYLLKDCAFEELARAIRQVMANRTYLSPAIAGVVVDAMKRRISRTGPTDFYALTDREREVLQLLAEGHSAKEIAGRLSVSIKTIGTHRQHIMDKIAIHNIAGLTKYAIQEGLTSAAP
jgi:DNA-binding NarL/FixJ family response regulator